MWTLLFSTLIVCSQGTKKLLFFFVRSKAQWTWLQGTQALNEPPVWGELNVPSPTNTPGGRGNAVEWIDDSDNLWIYGGGKNGCKLQLSIKRINFQPNTAKSGSTTALTGLSYFHRMRLDTKALCPIIPR
jgi:hypothetical protein